MIIDKLTEFCDATSVALAAGTHLLGNVVDLQEARDIGMSGPIFFQMRCATSIITGGSAGTIQFQLVSDAQAAIATDGSATVHWTSKAFVTDGDDANELHAGDVIAQMHLPLEGIGSVYERYVGVRAIVATTTVTAGAVDAFLTLDPTAWKALPDGQN
jgi:hypothetical protein